MATRKVVEWVLEEKGRDLEWPLWEIVEGGDIPGVPKNCIHIFKITSLILRFFGILCISNETGKKMRALIF